MSESTRPDRIIRCTTCGQPVEPSDDGAVVWSSRWGDYRIKALIAFCDADCFNQRPLPTSMTASVRDWAP